MKLKGRVAKIQSLGQQRSLSTREYVQNQTRKQNRVYVKTGQGFIVTDYKEERMRRNFANQNVLKLGSSRIAQKLVTTARLHRAAKMMRFTIPS
jgi:hypothetical protein